MANSVPPTVNIHDYIEASGDAARRTRLALFAIVVIGVLTLVGLLNSLRQSWMRLRFDNLQNPHGYLATQIGRPPSPPHPNEENYATRYKEYVDAKDAYTTRYKEYVASQTRAFVEGTNLVHVPVFGVSVDVNDLAILSGVSFIVTLTWLLFCIRAEKENLGLTLDKAKSLDQLPEAYRILSMRQVLTVPRQLSSGPRRYVKRATRSIRWIYFLLPKLLCFVPWLQFWVTVTDWRSRQVGHDMDMSWPRVYSILGLEALLSALILVFSMLTLIRWRQLDRYWSEYFNEYLFAQWRKDKTGDCLKRIGRFLKERIREHIEPKKPLLVELGESGTVGDEYKCWADAVLLTLRFEKETLICVQITDDVSHSAA